MATRTEDTVPDSAVDELAFLARSHHRIDLLTKLSRDEQTRRSLHDATGISQPTLGRILGDFEQRQWISNNHNGAYELTPLGALLADTVEDLLGVLDTIDHLTELTDHLPWNRFTFDRYYLSTARITKPTPSDPLAHMRRVDELAAHASTVTLFSNVLACAPSSEAATHHFDFLEDLDEIIVTEEALDTDLGDSALQRWLTTRIDRGKITVYRYDGPADFILGIFDETVGIVPIDDTGMPCGLIESRADPIRTWARNTIEDYRGMATRLTPDTRLEEP